jgi:CheY-like chemotaxis protein
MVGAFQMLEGHRKLDLIITDVNMPNMDGISFIRKARDSVTFKFVPILVSPRIPWLQDERRQGAARRMDRQPFSAEKQAGVDKKDRLRRHMGNR